jgi:peptidoglycan/xylan/chitin deacetylase (PgdA/CDA1 family)
VKPAILTYHSLDTSGSVISVAPAQFRVQMECLASRRVPVVPLGEIRTTPGGIALTFDDGFENFYTDAFPVLREFGFPATVFVVSGHCGGTNNWPAGGHQGIPSLPLMSWGRLAEMVRHGISLGVHTATHPSLPGIAEVRAREEMRRCQAMIQERIGAAADTLAYPYGDSNPRVRAIAAEYFGSAYGTRLAFVGGRLDSMDIPRIDAYYLRNRQWFEKLHDARGRIYIAARRSVRQARAAVARAR